MLPINLIYLYVFPRSVFLYVGHHCKRYISSNINLENWKYSVVKNIHYLSFASETEQSKRQQKKDKNIKFSFTQMWVDIGYSKKSWAIVPTSLFLRFWWKLYNSWVWVTFESLIFCLIRYRWVLVNVFTFRLFPRAADIEAGPRGNYWIWAFSSLVGG